jgi:hypothetical protein
MMHVLIASKSAWAGHTQACAAIAHRLLASTAAQPQTLVIDLATVLREEPSHGTGTGTLCPIPVRMRAWIDHFFRDQPMLDVERVHRAAQGLCVEGTLVAAIDATALDAGLIDRTLNQLRVAFYGCTHWPAVLVLVVDDAILHDVAGFAGRVFYIQPNVTGQSKINSLLGHLVHFSRMEGLFGLRHNLLNSLNKWINRPRGSLTVTEEK